MNNPSTPILVKKSYYLLISTILLILFTLPLVYFIWIDPADSLKAPYLQFNSNLIALPCIFYPLLIAMWLIGFLNTQVYLYEDRVEVKYRLKPKEVYYFKDLTGWDRGTDKNGVTDSCYLYFEDKTVPIRDLENVSEFENYFIEKKFRQHKGPQPARIGQIVILVAVIGVLLGSLRFGNVASEIREANQGTAKHLLRNMVLSKKPDARRIQKSSTGYEMWVSVKGVDGIYFELYNHTSLPAYRNEINWNTPIGDTVSIEILEYDYEVKIAHTRQPSFWDKHFEWDKIHAWRIKGKKFDIVGEY